MSTVSAMSRGILSHRPRRSGTWQSTRLAGGTNVYIWPFADGWRWVSTDTDGWRWVWTDTDGWLAVKAVAVSIVWFTPAT